MARRKKASRKTSRRRRMSGIGAVGSMASSVLYAVAGGVMAGAVTKYLPASLNDKVKSAIPVAVGLFLPKFVKGSAGAGIGAGMVAVGGLKLVQSFGVLNGISGIDMPGYQVPAISGSYNRAGQLDTSYMTPAIAGLDELGC
jgi:hypothetical protein